MARKQMTTNTMASESLVTVSASSGPSTSVHDLFQSFREELDEFNDRRERLIKASRDITNLSKKAIFDLQRSVLPDSTRDQAAVKDARKKLKQVQDKYREMREDVQGDRFWRHQRQVSPGLQEYIEALSFAYYLDHGKLITFADVQKSLVDENVIPLVVLTMDDYLLGLSDLTGELMRFAISGFSRRGGRAKAAEISTFVRHCKADFEAFTPFVRDLSKKQYVTSQSLYKIEEAAYAIAVRSSEYDLSPEMLDDLVGRTVSSFGSNSSRGGDRDAESHSTLMAEAI